MTRNWKTGAVLVVGVGVGAFLAGTNAPVAVGQGGRPTPPVGAFTVVETDATNLLVVDNTSNTLFYYTIEPGQKPGADMHLRGSIDLSQVGQPVLKPKKAKVD